MDQNRVITLISDVQQGKYGAETELYEACYKDLYYYILKILNNDVTTAEDVLQETFFTIFRSLHQLKEPAAFIGWSRRIAYNKCLEYVSHDRDLLVYESDEGYSQLDTLAEEREEFIPDEALDKADLKDTIQRIVDELPAEQKSAILLRYFDDLSVREIAQSQGISEGTVKSRLNYGRNAIRKAVEAYEKKNGIKLRCAGVAPLLAWLFHSNLLSAGTAAAGGAAATATTGTLLSSAAAKGGVKAGAAIAKKAISKKLIAGILAATVTTGGVTALVLSQSDPEPAPSNTFVGYGEIHSTKRDRRYEITVKHMDEQTISGQMTISYFYEEQYSTNFTGTGTTQDGVSRYDVNLETPYVATVLLTDHDFDTTAMIYNQASDILKFDDFTFECELIRESSLKERKLTENTVYHGTGENDGYAYFSRSKNHTFEMTVYQMTTTQVSGHLKVWEGDVLYHETEFHGQGLGNANPLWYEVVFEIPYSYTDTFWGTATNGSCYLKYNETENTIKIEKIAGYNAELSSEK